MNAKFVGESNKSRQLRGVAAAVCGIGVGFVNGLLGAGGGMLVVPVMTSVLGFSPKRAHATALFTILPLTVVSAVVYACFGGVDVGGLPPVAVGVLLGGLIGGTLLKKISSKLLSAVFLGVMMFAGLKMLLG